MRSKASLASRLLCVLFLLLFSRTAAAASVIYVDADAPGANNGSSWENAYVFLQDALADAETAEKPVEIRVAQGIYKPDQGVNHTLGDREATFQLINNVMLKGGYAGLGEPDTNARDIELYETILSGDLNGNDIQVDDPCDLRNEPSRDENSYHIVTGSDTDETAMLDGFTIADGSDDSETGPGGVMWSCGYGGGLYNLGGSPTLISCTFSNNWVSASGGGIYNENGNPILTNCVFRRNSSEICGGGMYNYTSNPTLTNCVFTYNYTGINGGGMYNLYSNTILTNCTFSENYSANEGGGMDNEYSNSTLINCTFFANSTCIAGGGMCNGGTYQETFNLILTDCTFIENSAMFAGGISNNAVSPKLTNCNFSGNSAIDGGGGIHNSASGPIMTNCTFNFNSAKWGGAIESRYSNPTITNCIISCNSATYGGATHNVESNLILTNCTFTQNSAQHGNTISCDSSPRQGSFPSNLELNNCILWNGGDEIWNNDTSTIDITYSNVQGGWPGKGNIDLDPCFAQPGYWDPNGTPDDTIDDFWIDGDYHLKSQAGRWDPVSESWFQDNVTSPCINAGDLNSPVAFEPFPNGGIINMGAYGGTPEASKSYALAKIIYVDDDAVGANNGSSWENAYVFLQDALADANSTEKPVEIRVAQGIYKPDQGANQLLGYREATFQLINGVTLKGGYAGLYKADQDAKDFYLYETVLSGDLAGDDLSWDELMTIRDILISEPNQEDNSFSVVTSSSTDETAGLDGFTISSGNAISHDDIGGGIYNYNGSPIIANCTIQRNSAKWDGGGMSCLDNSNPTLTNCTFALNYSFRGGGMYNSNSNPMLTNCVFTNNFTVIPNIIIERTPSAGGGIYNYRSNILLTDCTFIGNSASHGGGICNLQSNSIMTNCTFTANSGYYGGGIANPDSSPTLINCILTGNGTNYSYGGGMYGGSPILINCTISGNRAQECGGIYYSNPNMVNCIVWSNPSPQIIGSAFISYSNIQGDWLGEGNIDADPCFVNPGYWDPNGTPDNSNDDFWIDGDYHLKSQAGRWDPITESWIQDDITSPCIDAGDPNNSVAFEPYPNGGIINMGAYGGMPEASMSSMTIGNNMRTDSNSD